MDGSPWYCVLLESEQRNPQKKSALKHLTNALFGSGSSVNTDYSVDRGSFPLLVVLLSCVVLRCIVLRCIVLCCNLLCCFVLNCVALYCIALRCIAPIPSCRHCLRVCSSGLGHTRPHYSLTLRENAPEWKNNIWC